MSDKKNKKSTKPVRPVTWMMRWIVERGPRAVLRIVLIVVAVGIFLLVIVPSFTLSKHLTTTITAATETLTVSLRPGTELSWILPAGDYLVPEKTWDSECVIEHEIGDYVTEWRCSYDKRSRVTIRGPGDVTLEVSPEGRLSVEAQSNPVEANSTGCENDEPGFLVELFDKDDQLVPEFGDFARFEEEFRYDTSLVARTIDADVSDPLARTKSMRLPIVAAAGTVGSHVRTASTISNKTTGFWQPTLLAGDVTSFALNLPGNGKYQVQHERLDAGDVIEIHTGQRETDEANPDSTEATCANTSSNSNQPEKSIWGIVTIEEQTVTMSGATEVEQPVIRAVLHTTHREIFVSRLGSTPRGHTITAHDWTIISRWPNGQQMWVLFVSLTLVLTFVLQLGDWIGPKGLKSLEKKGKKHTERKRNSDKN